MHIFIQINREIIDTLPILGYFGLELVLWRHRKARIFKFSKFWIQNRIPPAKINLNEKFQVFIPFSREIMRRYFYRGHIYRLRTAQVTWHYFNHYNTRINNFKTLFLIWILNSIKFPFQRCIIWLFLNSLIFDPLWRHTGNEVSAGGAGGHFILGNRVIFNP